MPSANLVSHVAVVRTDLMREIGPGFRNYLESLPSDDWTSPDQGCAVLLVAAFDPSLSGRYYSCRVENLDIWWLSLLIDLVASGATYLADCRISPPAGHASDKSKAEKLWKLSEELTKSSAADGKL